LRDLPCQKRAPVYVFDIAQQGLNNWGRIPFWDCVQISISPHLPQHAGRTIADIAAASGGDPIDTLCDYLAEDQGATRVLVTSISENDIRTLVASPLVLVGSDGNCVAPYGIVSQGVPHPRFYGTFPRILSRYVREQRLLPLEQAIYKMTGATARALKLADRGLLKKGLRADLVMFDPNDFADRATFGDPHQFPTGTRTTVIVNGTLVVEDAMHTGALPGMVLRRDGTGAVM
jgi:N-acyl-D-aspartate/D-glutamate deacylase